MAVRIRLRQQGTTNHVMYRFVVTDSRNPRDGKYLEAIGYYNPCAKNEDDQISVKPDRVQHWISLGAEISENARNLIKKVAPSVLPARGRKKKKA